MATGDLDTALARIEAREQRIRRTARLLTFVPLVAALLLLAYASWKVSEAVAEARRQELRAEALSAEAARLEEAVASLGGELATVRGELAAARRALETAREQLEATVDMSRYRHELTPVTSKELASRFPRAAEALQLMVQLREQGVGWKLGGRSPREGFDSPGFAAWVLRELGVEEVAAVSTGDSLIATSRLLFEALPAAEQPRVGDLVFYPAGYVMFYYEQSDGEAFVAGMTPFGIVALEPDFAEPAGFRRSGLTR